jgi:carbonic anhydrase
MKRTFLLGWSFALACLLLTPGHAGPGAAPSPDASKMLRDAALMLLREGNARFVSGRTQHPNLDAERRGATAAHGQEPFATVLACSDSRVPVELIFDRGVGDLFVTRVAGNVAGDSELATIEYGLTHLGTPLLIVLGHSRCGAVTAAVKGTELHGHLPKLMEKIKPAADKARSGAADTNDVASAAIEANVWQTVADILRHSSLVRGRVAGGQAQIVGALHDLETGRVKWLGSHPEEESLLAKGLAAEQSQTPSSTPAPAQAAAPHKDAVSANVPAVLPPSATPVVSVTEKPRPARPIPDKDSAVHQGDPARLLSTKNSRPPGH